MRDYYYQIAGVLALNRESEPSEVEKKYDFATSMLELIVDNSSMLEDATFENLLNWIDESLEDIWKHKEKLPDIKKAEFKCLLRLVAAGLNISVARDHKQHSRSPAIRAAEESRILYWVEVARQTLAPTARSQKIAEKLQARYQW